MNNPDNRASRKTRANALRHVRMALLTGAALAATVSPAMAQDDTDQYPDEQEHHHDKDQRKGDGHITVIGHHLHSETEQPRVSEQQGAITVTGKAIEDAQATNLEEALRKVPSVQIDEVNGAQGVEIAVRGMTSDAVSVRVEGAPQNRSLIMHKNSNDRDTVWLNMDMYQSITVIPGAAASVYGSGSTGGVLLLSTKDPEYVIKPGRDWGAAMRLGHQTNGVGNHLSGDLAYKFNDWFAANGTISYSDIDAYKDSHGVYADYGSTAAETLSYLAKGVITPSESHRIELSVLNTHLDYSRFTEDDDDASVLDETRYKTNNRTFTGEWSWHPERSKLIDLKLRGSRSSSESDSKDLAAGDTAYANTGSVKTTYVELENSSTWDMSPGLRHQFRYGGDFTKDNVVMSYTDNVNGGSLTARREQGGAYVMDTLSFGKLAELTGTVRYDDYAISSEGVTRDGKSGISPTIQANVHPFERSALAGLSFRALWGKGYKSPTIVNMFGKGGNGIFTGTDEDGDGIYTDSDYGCVSGHGSLCYLANTNLKGERSNSYELGASYRQTGLFWGRDILNARVNYIHEKIKDRITAVTVGYTESGYAVTQYQNVEDAKVRGWELSANYDSKYLFADVSAQIMKGWDLSDGSRLEDVNPRSITAGLGTHFNDRKATIGMDMHSRARLEVDDTIYPSYVVFDVYGSYRFNDNLRLQARIANVFDKYYTKSSYTVDTIDDITYYAGRNLKVDLSYTF